jgi:ribonuclease BN (tRNA processing enzyme)
MNQPLQSEEVLAGKTMHSTAKEAATIAFESKGKILDIRSLFDLL